MTRTRTFQSQQVTMKVPPKVYQRLTEIREAMQVEETRAVTYGEVVQRLAEAWERDREALND
jgi:hypothetical protein